MNDVDAVEARRNVASLVRAVLDNDLEGVSLLLSQMDHKSTQETLVQMTALARLGVEAMCDADNTDPKDLLAFMYDDDNLYT